MRQGHVLNRIPEIWVEKLGKKGCLKFRFLLLRGAAPVPVFGELEEAIQRHTERRQRGPNHRPADHITQSRRVELKISPVSNREN